MWAQLVKKWPSRDDPTGLLKQQWDKHGRFTSLEALAYFAKGLELYDEVTKLDPILGLSPGVDTTQNIAENVANVLEKTYGTKAYPQVVCEQRVDMTKPCRLEEFRICFQIGPRLKLLVDCPTPFDVNLRTTSNFE
ncbi:hypothetical protein CASFOL_003195 [Castilleja foliolosa]|uniref:Uncharacterized protein n=1 Tax=Castilleja foliolosa TaxID=1961234 RepID=A0ABD3EJU5_9LAMI